MGLYTGFAEGLIIGANAGDAVMLPFQDKIGAASFQYASETLLTETFSSQGIKGASAACPFREEASITFESQDITWAFLQAVFNTLDAAAADVDWSETFILTATTGTPVVSSATLSFAPVVGEPIEAADDEGVNYPVTVAGTTATFATNLTGKKVTIKYTRALTGRRVIEIGKGSRLRNVGVYGRFFGCPDDLAISIPNGIIEATVDFGVGDQAASASLMVKALRDSQGAYAYLTKL